MMPLLRITFLILISCNLSYSQSKFCDSIVFARKTEHLGSKIKCYYSPRCKQRAKKYYALFSSANKFYELRYHSNFNYRMAVLDSAQWITEKYPFGFLNYDSGWVFLPSVINPSLFYKIYGIENKKSDLNYFLKVNHITSKQLSDAVYFVYSLHELGHYFTDDYQKCVIPDMFANELVASYFSYCYFKKHDERNLKILLNFSKFIKNNYKPLYSNIDAMDKLYDKMSIQNFKWFHCNIILLCDMIYKKYGIDFLDYYLKAFHVENKNSFTAKDVIQILEKKSHGIVTKWSNKLTKGK